MPGDLLASALRCLRPLDASADPLLLERFATRREQAAFAELLRRHGALVWGVCRRILRHHQDAEDAFQATFLVLALRAAAVQGVRSLANWLYGVARRCALQVQRQATRRRRHEHEAPAMKQANIEGEIGMREFLAVLDEEVARLPEKLRLPLVLCCLEGKTQAEAAEELGWKEGTLSGRLAEARERLRRRLTKRGIALSAAWGALTLGQDATAVPLRLAEATLRAALHPETASVSVSVAAVVQGVSKALVFGRLKMMARFLFVFTVLGTGAGAWALRASDTPSPAAPAKNRPTPGADHQAKDKPVANDQHGDPLPEGAVLRLGTLRLRHSHTAIGRGLGLAFLADGKTLVSAGDDHTIRFWDLKTGKEVRRLIEPDPANLTLAMTLDGPRLVVAGSKGIRLFDATTAAERRAIPTRGLGQPMAFSADGKSLASIDDRLGFHVWDVTTGKERLAGKGLDAGVRSLCFSADGKKLVTGLTNATTLIWRIPAAR